MRQALFGIAALAALLLWGGQAPAAAKEYILASVKPNTLVLADPAARKVTRTYPIAGPGPILGIVTSPDGKTAYAVTDHWGALVGIDLDSGKEVFHAEFSDDDLRVRNMFGLEISHDGKELFVLQSPVLLGKSEYQVQEPRIAVYPADGGLKAKPVRFLPVPRRTTTLLLSDDGSKLYSFSWDITAIDPKDGKVLGVTKLTHWDRPHYAEPDVFPFWSQFEQARVFAAPYFVSRTDLDPQDPAASKTGIITFDLKTGELTSGDIENTSVVLFTSVVNPVRRNEVYSVYTTLTKSDRFTNALIKRVPLPHTYYAVNVSGDGKEIYTSGGMNDIGVYSSETLEKLGQIDIPGGADQAISWARVIKR